MCRALIEWVNTKLKTTNPRKGTETLRAVLLTKRADMIKNN